MDPIQIKPEMTYADITALASERQGYVQTLLHDDEIWQQTLSEDNTTFQLATGYLHQDGLDAITRFNAALQECEKHGAAAQHYWLLIADDWGVEDSWDANTDPRWQQVHELAKESSHVPIGELHLGIFSEIQVTFIAAEQQTEVLFQAYKNARAARNAWIGILQQVRDEDRGIRNKDSDFDQVDDFRREDA